MLRLITFIICFMVALLAFGKGIEPVKYYDIDDLYNDQNKTKAVYDRLNYLLLNIPHVSQVRIGLIHMRVGSTLNFSEYLFDIAYVKTNPGYISSKPAPNIPLTQWRAYLGDLIDDKCPYVKVSEMQDAGVKERLGRTNTSALIGCPLLDSKGYLVGVLFTLWQNSYPDPTNIDSSIATMRVVAKEISTELKADNSN